MTITAITMATGATVMMTTATVITDAVTTGIATASPSAQRKRLGAAKWPPPKLSDRVANWGQSSFCVVSLPFTVMVM